VGSVKLHGPDRYCAVLRWTDELGTSLTRTKTKAETEQALREFRAERAGYLEKVRPTTIGALADEWLNSRHGDVSEATFVQYKWLALRWSDFDTDNLALSITTSRKRAGSKIIEAETKTARSIRRLPVPKTVANFLEAHRNAQRVEVEHLLSLGIRAAELGYMFLSELGRPLDPDNASKAFKRFARTAGLGDRHVQELRHLSASLLLARDVPMPEISRILGHSTSRVIDEVYSHLSVKDLRPALEKVWK